MSDNDLIKSTKDEFYNREKFMPELEKIPRDKLEAIVKNRLKLKIRSDFNRSRWQDLSDEELREKMLEICLVNRFYPFEIMEMVLLYRGRDILFIAKSPGDVMYYYSISNQVIEKYGLENVDYEELVNIIIKILDYIDNERFYFAILRPTWRSSGSTSFHHDLTLVLRKIVEFSKSVHSDIEWQNFISEIRSALDKAYERYNADILTR